MTTTREEIAVAFGLGAAAVVKLAGAAGLLPGHNCLRCSRALTAGELRATVYTGTCVACRLRPPEPEFPGYPPEPPTDRWDIRPRTKNGIEPSGAAWWSHPTPDTSWRCDRATVLAFKDCECCGGTGATLTVNTFGQAIAQCLPCMERHRAHPDIVAEEDEKNAVGRRVTAWRQRMDAEFKVRIEDAMRERSLTSITQELRDEVAALLFKDGPPEPTTDAEAVFPATWATLGKDGKPKAGKKGKPRKARTKCKHGLPSCLECEFRAEGFKGYANNASAPPDAPAAAPTDRRTAEAADF